MDQRHDLRWYAWSLAAASLAYGFVGKFAEAEEEARGSLSISEQYGDDSLISFAHWCLSVACTLKGDAKRAIEHAQISVEGAPTPADRVWGQTFLGWALCRAGRAREGADLLASVLPLYEVAEVVIGQVWMSVYLSEAYWRAGQVKEAERTLEKGLALAKRGGIRAYVGWLERLLAEVALMANLEQIAEPLAAPHFQASISMLRDIKAENELALAYAGYGRLHRRQGRIEESRDYLTRALEIFERLGTRMEPDKVRAELAELPDSSHAE